MLIKYLNINVILDLFYLALQTITEGPVGTHLMITLIKCDIVMVLNIMIFLLFL